LTAPSIQRWVNTKGASMNYIDFVVVYAPPLWVY